MAQFASPKGPTEVKEYTLNWADALNDSESIVTSDWTAPTGITIDDDANTATTATVILSGGTAGVEYAIENTITTNSTPARTLVETLFVPVTTL